MLVTTGGRLHSAVSDTSVIVIRAAADVDLDLRCGGVALSDAAVSERRDVDPEFAEASLLGKRYVDAAGLVELLVVKGGAGALSIGSEHLIQKEAKKLPSTD
jgi:hypothetical protein